MKQVFVFLRKAKCRTGYWDGTELLCFHKQWPNLGDPHTSFLVYSARQAEQVEELNDLLRETFGDTERWFHV